MRTIAVLIAVTAAAVALSFLMASCSSLPKDEIERRLAALPKNKAAAALGYSTSEAVVSIDGKSRRVQFSWLHAGTPGKPKLLLIHGTPGSAMSWSELIFGTSGFDGLLGDFDIYALEVIGHGSARSELSKYSFQACADYIHAFLDTQDLRDVCIVGQSYGGEFAWRAALDAPDRISRVVLVDSAGMSRNDDEWLPEEVKLRDWPGASLGYLLNSRERIRGALQPHFQTPVADERVEEMFLNCDNSDNWGAVVDLARDENGTRSAELSKLTQPTLLVWGELDIAYTVERFARRFEAAIPSSRLVQIADCGHYPHEERPAELARLLREFMSAGR